MSRRKRITVGLLIIIPVAIVALTIGAYVYLLLPENNTISDCIWTQSAIAFVDTNANGVRDSAEPPLKDVHFHIDDMHNHITNIGSAQTNATGEAKLFLWLPGCPTTKFEVYTDPLPGYSLITSARLNERDVGGNPYVFGYKANP